MNFMQMRSVLAKYTFTYFHRLYFDHDHRKLIFLSLFDTRTHSLMNCDVIKTVNNKISLRDQMST
jgi:hypothetical protein